MKPKKPVRVKEAASKPKNQKKKKRNRKRYKGKERRKKEMKHVPLRDLGNITLV